MNGALKKLKRRKAPGPDETPMEIFKEMNEETRQEILNITNKWWNNTKSKSCTNIQKKKHKQIRKLQTNLLT